jgi:uncharacterized protein (UPF0332 family)
VTPEAEDYLKSARHHLANAQVILDATGITDQAARLAYQAGFNAAQALVITRRGRAAKTHRGLRTVFAELAQDEASIDSAFTTFLGQAYSLKERTDYGIGDLPDVTDAEAQEMIDMAERLIDCVAQLLASEP